jgi:hypothetical protein
VLAESLNNNTTSMTTTPSHHQQNLNLAYTGYGGGNEISVDLARVLEMSRREEERREQLRKQEDEELERIIQLSLLEK